MPNAVLIMPNGTVRRESPVRLCDYRALLESDCMRVLTFTSGKKGPNGYESALMCIDEDAAENKKRQNKVASRMLGRLVFGNALVAGQASVVGVEMADCPEWVMTEATTLATIVRRASKMTRLEAEDHLLAGRTLRCNAWTLRRLSGSVIFGTCRHGPPPETEYTWEFKTFEEFWRQFGANWGKGDVSGYPMNVVDEGVDRV